jgi:hypothetical protein
MIPYSACILRNQTECVRENVALLPILLLSVGGDIKCVTTERNVVKELTDWLTG